MSPIDDELRDALHRRATVLAPSPDPLAGIERRAHRMRRNRVAASVAGSVLAVAAVATAVPLIGGTTSPAPDAPPIASTGPSPVPSPAPSSVTTPSPFALDPAAPWAYRGTALDALGTGTVDTVRREVATAHGAAESSVTLSPLFGRVYEPSQQVELVYVAQVDDAAFWGVALSSEAGPELAVDEPLAAGTTALVAALPGDEVGRLLVVAAPQVGSIEYGPDDASEFSTMTALADGVATTALEGDPATDSVRVLDRSGREVFRAPAPEVAGSGPTGPEVPPTTEPPTPTNVVDWPARGTVSDDLRERAVAAFAQEAGVPVAQLRTRLLFGGQLDGRTYVLLQGWYGSDARSFVWSYDPQGDVESSVLQSFTPPGPALFAAELDGVLLVVPEPLAGQVLYAPDATSEPQPVPDQGTEVAVLIDRAEDATGDRLLVLDGDGDPENPLYRGTVDGTLEATR